MAARLLAEGRPAEAAVRLEALTRAAPAYAVAHVLLAKAYEAVGQPADALAAWHRAYFLVPTSPLVRRERQRLLDAQPLAAPPGVAPEAPNEEPAGAALAPQASGPFSAPEPEGGAPASEAPSIEGAPDAPDGPAPEPESSAALGAEDDGDEAADEPLAPTPGGDLADARLVFVSDPDTPAYSAAEEAPDFGADHALAEAPGLSSLDARGEEGEEPFPFAPAWLEAEPEDAPAAFDGGADAPPSEESLQAADPFAWSEAPRPSDGDAATTDPWADADGPPPAESAGVEVADAEEAGWAVLDEADDVLRPSPPVEAQIAAPTDGSEPPPGRYDVFDDEAVEVEPVEEEEAAPLPRPPVEAVAVEEVEEIDAVEPLAEEAVAERDHGPAAGGNAAGGDEPTLADELDALIRQLGDAPRIRPDSAFDAPPLPSAAEDEDDEMVSETLARIYAAQQQFAEAAAVYETLARQRPEQADDLLRKAAAMRAQGGEG